MFQRKALVVVALLSTLLACSSDPKKESDKDTASHNLYDLPETVDLEKAARLNVELGVSYLNQGQIARAKSKFTRARNLAPQLPEVHYSFAYFQERQGEIEGAEKSYLKAISLNPKGGNEHNNYGAFLCRQQQYRKAEKEFMKAIEDPNYMNTSEAIENAGLCVLQIPDTAKAAEYFEKALRYDPSRANALIELAVIYYKEGKWSQASDYHARFAQFSKPTARSLLLGIELAKNVGDRNKEASYRMLLKAQFPEAKPTDLFHVAMLS